jgi:hypothetical protein
MGQGGLVVEIALGFEVFSPVDFLGQIEEKIPKTDLRSGLPPDVLCHGGPDPFDFLFVFFVPIGKSLAGEFSEPFLIIGEGLDVESGAEGIVEKNGHQCQEACFFLWGCVVKIGYFNEPAGGFLPDIVLIDRPIVVVGVQPLHGFDPDDPTHNGKRTFGAQKSTIAHSYPKKVQKYSRGWEKNFGRVLKKERNLGAERFPGWIFRDVRQGIWHLKPDRFP